MAFLQVSWGFHPAILNQHELTCQYHLLFTSNSIERTILRKLAESRMSALLLSLFILGLVAFAALRITQNSPLSPELVNERATAARALEFAVVAQAAHFTEEVLTGFHERFPALFGLPPIPLSFFLTFNLVWLVIWVASVSGLRAGSFAALFAAWFLAIAAVLNGIAHPLLAVAANGYFPGLATSPYIGLAGVWLWMQLRTATREVST
jgi:hypothetical protein